MNPFKLPKLGLFILEFLLYPSDRDHVIGSFIADYEKLCMGKGRVYASVWFWVQLFLSILPLVKVQLMRRTSMFKNYLKIAVRNIKKHKGYTFINVSGLAVGMTCCILMILWVQNELSYDRFHEHADDIYRVVFEKRTEQGTFRNIYGPTPLGSTLKEVYPEIIDFINVAGPATGWHLKYGEKGFLNDIQIITESRFFKLFTFPFVKGNPETALKDRYSIVLTEKMAKKYFDNEEPMGKIIYDEESTRRGYKVTGIIKNIPPNSHIQFDYIIPKSSYGSDNWAHYGYGLYLQIRENISGNELSEKIAEIIKEHQPETSIERVFLQPLRRIHLYSELESDVEGRRNITYVYLLSITALSIFLIACINYMNLSTARFALRAKEIGIRKISGAYRNNIIGQFFTESILLSLLALPFAVVLTEIALPVFNSLSGKQLSMDYISNLYVLPGLFIITILTGIISGIYPALFLSSFQPVKILKGISTRGIQRSVVLRKILIITQFSLTIILIIGIITIYSQLSYMKNKDLGFDKDNLISFEMHGKFNKNYENIKNELLQHPDIINITKSIFTLNSNLPRFWGNTNPVKEIHWEGKNPGDETIIYPVEVDYDYLETFNIKLIDGRFFSKDYSTDTSHVLLTETAVKTLGIESPVGKNFSFKFESFRFRGVRTNEGLIIGVVNDYHQCSLHNKIQPMFLTLKDFDADMTVKIRSENMAETIRFIDSKWKEYMPGFDLPYQFIDESISSFYKADERIFTIFKYFTYLAIFIACLGLFGMASFMAERRTKEIGIRKTLGASLSGIILLLTKEFTGWVLLANMIAWPVAYFSLNRWLQNFAYRVHPNIIIFILAGVLTLVIALLIVSYQAVKAANANPVEALRFE